MFRVALPSNLATAWRPQSTQIIGQNEKTETGRGPLAVIEGAALPFLMYSFLMQGEENIFSLDSWSFSAKSEIRDATHAAVVGEIPALKAEPQLMSLARNSRDSFPPLPRSHLLRGNPGQKAGSRQVKSCASLVYSAPGRAVARPGVDGGRGEPLRPAAPGALGWAGQGA